MLPLLTLTSLPPSRRTWPPLQMSRCLIRSWHRDESPFPPAADEIFGGWVNLGENENYFTYAKGTHTEPRGTGGFAKITNPAPYDAKRVRVTVPPGHMVIFYEHVAHEVTSVPVQKVDLRLFIGWRLTHATTPLIADINKRLDEQGIVRIKSGQECPMHAALHWYVHEHCAPPTFHIRYFQRLPLTTR